MIRRMPRNDLIARAPAVLFLGAGASAGLGKPAMGAFMSQLTETLNQRFPRLSALNDLIRHTNRDLEELLDVLSIMLGWRWIRSVEVEGGSSHLSSLPPLPTEADPYQESFKSGPRLPSGGAELVMQAIQSEVIKEYRDIDAAVATRVFSPLMDLIFTHVDSNVSPLPITTNYDPAIERFVAANPENYHLVDGFVYASRERREVWDPAHFDRFDLVPGKRNLVLFKLHGSTDWIKIDSRICRAEPSRAMFQTAMNTGPTASCTRPRGRWLWTILTLRATTTCSGVWSTLVLP